MNTDMMVGPAELLIILLIVSVLVGAKGAVNDNFVSFVLP